MSERCYGGVERERERERVMWMGGRGEMNQCISLPQSGVSRVNIVWTHSWSPDSLLFHSVLTLELVRKHIDVTLSWSIETHRREMGEGLSVFRHRQPLKRDKHLRAERERERERERRERERWVNRSLERMINRWILFNKAFLITQLRLVWRTWLVDVETYSFFI